jgi:hypothetical protein
MQLADDWREMSVDRSGMSTTLLRVFSPVGCPEVKLQIFRRGYPMEALDAQAFRKALAGAPNVIFEKKEQKRPSQTEVNALTELKEVLGNAGNNQVINTRKDYLGPSFMIERLDALIWKGKSVLAARGWFRDTDEDVRVNDYCGIFIDGSAGNSPCQVDEIFLESPNEELYTAYLPAFKEFLDSIAWQVL